MALHEVDIEYIDKRSYTVKMLDEFIASDMKCAEVDVPEGYKMEQMRLNLYNRIKGRGLIDKFAVFKRKGHLYLARK